MRDELYYEFYLTPQPLLAARIPIYVLVAVFLFAIRHPYLHSTANPVGWLDGLKLLDLGSRRETASLAFLGLLLVIGAIVSFMRGGSPLFSLRDNLQFQKYTFILGMLLLALPVYLILPIWPKILLLTVLLGEVLVRMLESLLLLIDHQAFLVISRAGVEGRTAWGRQTVPWMHVVAATVKRRKTLFRECESLVISTALLSEPEGFLARIRAGGGTVGPISFHVPAHEQAQLGAILQAINMCEPSLQIDVEESGARQD
ncbi:hypothetical protein [Aestuariivirga sp.]|uniref:hypothetical protein n=1 Tax=Aestuariivirga sp. TaxID=2650926 RepID=UPI003BAA4537